MKSHQFNRFPGITVVAMATAPQREKVFFAKPQKQALLAVAASALMLGASQAGSTVGINFQGSDYYGENGGAVIVDTAFGIPASGWTNAPDPSSSSVSVGSVSVLWPNTSTMISGITNSAMASLGLPCYPGDGNLFYGYLDAVDNQYSVSLNNLAATFPNGYVVQTMAAADGGDSFRDVQVTGGTDSSTMPYTLLPKFSSGAIAGYSAQSATFTSNTLTIRSAATGGSGDIRRTLAGFIITDKPVVSRPLVGASIANGGTFTLTASVVALPTGLHYQWRHTTPSGTVNVGTDSPTYTVTGATSANNGSYDVLVTNSYGSATSTAATVTVAQSFPYDSWVSGFTWPVGADQTRSGDPDGDGFSNLQEFLFGTTPLAGNSSLTTTETSGGNLIIRWKQRLTGSAYTLKESSTLANNWVTSSAPVSNDGSPTGDYQPKMATVATGSNKNFFRLEGVEN